MTMFNDTTAVLKSLLSEGDIYTQAETALCIWEHIIEETHNKDDSLYRWITQEQGVFYGRQQAIELAYLVELAYQTGNGDDYALGGSAFDWEIVLPIVLAQFMERTDRPSAVTQEMAIEVGKLLPELL